jgi:hypothetical protein
MLSDFAVITERLIRMYTPMQPWQAHATRCFVRETPWHELCGIDKHPSQHAGRHDPCATVVATKGEKMSPSKKTTPKQPRFVLSMREGQLTYTCRGCQQHCHHPASIVRHLQACQAR